MTFYFIPFIFLAVLTSLESYKRLNFFTQSKLIYSFIALFFIIFIGLRYEIGCDWIQYKAMFEKYEFLSISDIFKRNFIGEDNLQKYQELGHIFITKISQNIYILNLIYSLLFSLPLFYFCSKLKRKYFSLLISYPYYIVVVGMGPIRQAACISFLMLSILFISNKKYYSHLLLSIISLLIHQFSIIFNTLILGSLLTKLRSIKLSKLNTFLIIIVFIVFTFCLPSIISKTYTYFTFYKKIDSDGVMMMPPAKSAILLWIMNLMPSIIFLKNKKIFKINDNLKNILSIFSVLEICLLPIVLIQSIIGYRLILYLFPNSIYITSLIPDLNILNIKKTYMVNFFILISFTILITWLRFAYHSSCWVPYENILFN